MFVRVEIAFPARRDFAPRNDNVRYEIGFVFSFFVILAAPCDGAVYVCPPLMGEAACFMRKIFVFGAGDYCKCCWGREV